MIDKFSLNINDLLTLWNDDYDLLLETLLEHYTFDFDKVTQEFNRIAREVTTKMNKTFSNFNESQLRQIWTYIESEKIRKLPDYAVDKNILSEKS